jgi:hypothetical protein
MKPTLPGRPLQRAILFGAALLLVAAQVGPLGPEFREAAPPGWAVEGKQEESYAWLRFATSMELDGEDYDGPAITLYRVPVSVDPLIVGSELARIKVDAQRIVRRTEVDRKVAGVRWKGFEADYLSESGTTRTEFYLFTGAKAGAVHVFWARGPRVTWGMAVGLCEKALVKVSSLLAGKGPEEAGGGESG